MLNLDDLIVYLETVIFDHVDFDIIVMDREKARDILDELYRLKDLCS